MNARRPGLFSKWDDPDHHRCGLFYVNPNDDRLWVPNRIGMGWTLNYARPAAYWTTAFILILVGVILYFSLHTGPTRLCRSRR